MHKVLIAGAGKIGSLITVLLADTNDYQIFLTDINIQNENLKRLLHGLPNITLSSLDAQDADMTRKFLQTHKVESIISSLPYYCNVAIAKIAQEFNLNYFDLTEDTHVTEAVSQLSTKVTSAFVPQCGLAPGFISIVANNIMQRFPTLDTVKMRVGALPINISNALQYSLTWSTDGLINEYGNLCHAIENNEVVNLLPLDDLEEIKVDGLTYEAFNTSGGIGSLSQTYKDRVRSLSYKTIRYPGHCNKMRFLMNDLKLNYDRPTLKRILENALPMTYQDVVVVYVSVSGIQHHQFCEETYVKKFYPKKINGLSWSAIQLTTASAICTAVDLVTAKPHLYKNLVRQEQFSLEDVTTNRFGKYYA